MTAYVFDIETNSIEDVTEIFCIVALDIETGVIHAFNPDNLEEAYDLLKKADILIGHNIVNYDIPWIKKIAGVDLSDKKVIDTLVVSRLTNPVREKGHGLKVWGETLNFPKSDFEEFDRFSEEMLMYCRNDVLLNKKVYDTLKREASGFSRQSLDIETKVARLVRKQEEAGFLFDEKEASLLLAELQEKMDKVTEEVKKTFKPKRLVTTLYSRKNKDGGISKMAETLEGKRVRLTDEDYEEIIKSGTIDREKIKEFKLGSRKQIGEYLQEFGWKPKKFTKTGQPIIDERVLANVKNIPEAQMISQYLMLQKRIAQLTSWFKALREDGRVHGFINHNGTITGRMTHRNPNMSQVPSCAAPYGKECRACWVVPPKHKLVGIDASGLELRMLAHYMNDEEFINEILNGDIHKANQKLAGIESRDKAKTFIYALIYGAGNNKLGSVVGGNIEEGKRLRDTFMHNLPAFKNLIRRVERASTKGYLKGLDGRRIIIRSRHSALNALLQSGGSIAMKQALILFDNMTRDFGARIVGNIHDEWQVEVPDRHGLPAIVGEAGVMAIRKASEILKLNCPLDGEFKIGNNWSETH
jgi:DNA polymerase-1